MYNMLALQPGGALVRLFTPEKVLPASTGGREDL